MLNNVWAQGMKNRLLLSFLALGFCALGQSQVSAPAAAAYAPVHNFDAKRDAASDVRAAVAEGKRTGKRIIVEVGGDWCPYCREMDKLFREHPDLLDLRDKNFVTVAVYYGPDNKNREFLAHYPKLLGVPHFFLLETDGTVLHSQRLVELRTGGKYDPEKIKAFLLKWAEFKSAVN